MPWRIRAFAPTAVLVFLAACMGDSTDQDAPVDTACTGPACDGSAAVAGLVVDDEERALEGAAVALDPAGPQTITDAKGRFRFENIPPGAYQVNVSHPGFAPALAPVEAAAGEVRNVTVRMAAVHVEHPFHEVIGPLSGMFSCGVGTPARIAMCHTYAEAAFAQDKPRLEFRMSAAHWETFVGEMRWTQGTAATSTHLANYMSYDGTTNGLHWWCAADGPSPIVFRFERSLPSQCTDQGVTNPLPSPDMTLIVAADVGFAGTDTDDPPVRAALQQRFELMMTIFYGEPGPPVWTAFDDA